MRTWDEHVKWLRARHTRLGDVEAKVALAEAYRELAAEERWTFLVTEGMLTTEPVFTSGTVAVTKGNTAVAFTPGDDGLLWSAAWKNRRILIVTRDEVYKVTVTGTQTGTLAPAWNGETATGLSFVMFRSVYEMPEDCDYGRELCVLDPSNGVPMPLVPMVQMRHANAYVLGQTGVPEAVARVELQQDVTGEPVQMMEFGPTAPSAAFSYPVYYFKKLPPIAAGSSKPLWPENYEMLIPERAEIKLEENPRHRIVLSPEYKRKHYARLFDLKKVAAGGPEIYRRFQLVGETGGGRFMNVRLGGGGYNPLTGEQA